MKLAVFVILASLILGYTVEKSAETREPRMGRIPAQTAHKKPLSD